MGTVRAYTLDANFAHVLPRPFANPRTTLKCEATAVTGSSSYGMLLMPWCKVRLMVRFIAIRFFALSALLPLASLALAQTTSTSTNGAVPTVPFSAPRNPAAVAAMGKLPPLPAGKSTVIGGVIRSINPVLDRLTLKVFGGHTMKILFDERTQVFLNGNRISVLDLHAADHASVETTLDGSKVFALRIHMLTHLPQGQSEGQVVSYDAQSGRLTLNPVLSQQPIVLQVPANTPIVRVGEKTFAAGQEGPSDLTPGSLVRVTFTASGTGHGVATHIDVLATNGANFVFAGVLGFLDVANGQMTIVDPRDRQRYQIAFNPGQFAVTPQLRVGSHVRVNAKFNGHQYIATSIAVE